MFDIKNIDTYKSIKASENLRERVVNIQPIKKNTMILVPFGSRNRRFYACAACLVFTVFITFAVAHNHGGIAVYVDGNEVGSAPMQVYPSNSVQSTVKSMTLSVPTVSVLMKIKAGRNTEVTVSDGVLIRSDNESQLDNPASASLQMSGDEQIVWDIGNPSMADIPRMTIKLPGKVLTYLLECNESTGIWTIKLNNEAD